MGWGFFLSVFSASFPSSSTLCRVTFGNSATCVFHSISEPSIEGEPLLRNNGSSVRNRSEQCSCRVQPCCLGSCTPAAPGILCFTELSSCSVQTCVGSLLADWHSVMSLSLIAVISRTVVYVSIVKEGGDSFNWKSALSQ